MRLTANDILAYNYCPVLQKEGHSIVEPLTIMEEALRGSVLLAEKRAIDKDSYPNLGKLIRAWDKVWWPTATKEGLTAKNSQTISIRAVTKLTDYCKYDISDEDFPTVAVDISTQRKVGDCVVEATVDLIKVPLEEKNHILIVDLGRKGLDHPGVAANPAVLTNAYLFVRDKETSVMYSCVDLDERKSGVRVSTAVFRPTDLEIARRMLYHTIEGIQKGIHLPKPWLCDNCKRCQRILE